MAIQARESRRGHRLVDRVPHFDPRITARDTGGVVCQEVRKIGLEQVRVARSGAVMDEARDDLDAALAQMLEAFVVPREIELAWGFRRHRLPKNGIAHRLDPDLCHGVEIGKTRAMPGIDQLIAIAVADPHDRAFDAAPQLQQWSGRGHSAATAVGCGRSLSLLSSILRKVASACPTIWSIL